MTALRSLSRAMTLGFFRDRSATFFTIIFPLMFLVLFGGIFKNQTAPKSTVVQIGEVAVLDQIPAAQRSQLDDVLDLQRDDDRADALRKVRKGTAAAAVEQSGSRVVLHYSAADQVRAGTVQGLLTSLVHSADLVAAGVRQPAYTLEPQQVEDQSVQAIQYVTPGLLGWAIATSATFGAAMTLVTWRQKKLLRRLRLAPVRTSSLVGARVVVSLGVALMQTAIFLGVALIPFFGLRLSGSWWMSIPLVVAGTLSFLSIGLLAGAWAKTPEAANAIANLIVLPMAFLSGAFFPLDSAPGWLQAVSKVFPLHYLVDGMRAVMVQGQGPASTLPALGILLAFAAVVTAVAAPLIRWDDV